MEKQWVKNGKYKTVDEYIKSKTGQTLDILCASDTVKYICPGIHEIAEKIRAAVSAKKKITVIVDYDADGICSGAEIYMILKALGADMKIIIPKRKSDGYGMNLRMLEDAPDNSVIITIDNGIAAIEPIAEAKRRGMEVYIMDHHLQGPVIPNADIIVDPEAFPQGWTFAHYCGAGLTFKLAQDMFPDNQEFLDKLSCFAAIATVADSVNVTGDNRNIILRGLRNLNARVCTDGMKAVLNVLRQKDKLEHVDIYELAYKLGPMINAPGRLHDDGGLFVLKTFFQTGEKANEFAQKLFDINQSRKELVDQVITNAEPKGEKIAFLFDKDIPEGICGIIAGHLASEMHKPTFVMTYAEDGTIKGSARSEENVDVFELMQHAKEKFTKFGGHKCAAGFSLEAKDLDEVFQILEDNAPDAAEDDKQFYDLDLKGAELLNAYLRLNRLGVYGEGLELPVIRFRGQVEKLRYLGDDKQHFSCTSSNIKCIGFSLADKYREKGEPPVMFIYGTLTTNWWNGHPSVQFQMQDFEV